MRAPPSTLLGTRALLFAAAAALCGAPALARGGAGETAAVKIPARRSFQVAPIAMRLRGRPGQAVPFELKLRGGDRPRKLAVRIVRLKQQESGAIGLDDLPLSRAEAALDTPAEVALAAGGVGTIRGRVFVDPAGSAFQAVGVLVSDASAPDPVDRSVGETPIAVHFRLRYLARIEIRVQGGRNARASELRIVEGGLVDEEGRAQAKILVENPTNTAFELTAEAQLFRQDSGVRLGRPFPLVHPLKRRRTGPARRSVRILGGARIRLEDLVPEPVAPGRYVMRVKLQAGREQVRAELPIHVEEGAFPAQAAVLPRVVSSVLVSPPRVELGLGRGGTRLMPLLLENEGKVAVAIDLSPVGFETEAAPRWLVVRPRVLSLAPGGRRRVAVMFRGTGDLAPNRYAFLKVDVRPRDGAPGGAQQLPVALAGLNEAAARAKLGEIVVRGLAGGGVEFSIAVRNPGRVHLSLDGSLTVTDPFGRKLERLVGGFGAWVLPGREAQIRFPLQRKLLPGEYLLQAEIRVTPQGRPRRVKGRWRRKAKDR